MNTIMTIAYNANKTAEAGPVSEDETAFEPKVRLMYEINNTELNLLDDLQEKLEVVHPAYESVIQTHPEEILAAQKKIEAAVRAYEDRIYKRPPLDIA